MGWKRERILLPISQICDLLFCSLCEKLLEDPVQCARCEFHFCRVCLEKWKDNNIQCPRSCYDPLYTEPHMLMRYMLNQVELKCVNTQFGCSENPILENLFRHESECKFKPVECPCCGMKIRKEDQKLHQKDCLKQVWKCPKSCSYKTSLRSEMEAHNCHDYLNQELKQVDERFEELKQKGARESGKTFVEVMTENLKYQGYMTYLKVKKENIFPPLSSLLKGYD